MQRRAFHSDEIRRPADIAAEPVDLGQQIFPLEGLAGLAEAPELPPVPVLPPESPT